MFQATFCRRRHQPRRPPPARIGPGRPAPAMGLGTAESWKTAISMLASKSNAVPPSKELHVGKLSETVIVHGNAPHNRQRFVVNHLIGNRASFLCTKAPMLRMIPETNFLQGMTSISLIEQLRQLLFFGQPMVM